MKATIQHKILSIEEKSGKYLGRELCDIQLLEFICFPSACVSGKCYDADSQTGLCRASLILTGKFTACHRAAGHGSISTSQRETEPRGSVSPSALGPFSTSLQRGIFSVRPCNMVQWHMFSFRWPTWVHVAWCLFNLWFVCTNESRFKEQSNWHK